MQATTKIGVLGAAMITALVSLTAPASAAVRSWSPDPADPVTGRYPSNWRCSYTTYADACLISSHNGTERNFKAVLIAKNPNNFPIHLQAAVINMWGLPSPSKQIRDDGCLNSMLSPHYAAACYGTAAALSAVCFNKPGATNITANAAITIPETGYRGTVVSPLVAVSC